MNFISFRAYQGDSFVISDDETSILIDGGMPNTFGQIKNYVEEYPLDAVFITHVDYDHLGGVFNLVTDDDLELGECDFYMNHPEIPCEYQGEEVGFKHGDSLKTLLARRGKTFKSVTADQKIAYGSIGILALSPDEATVSKLYKSWGDNVFFDNGTLKYKKKQTQSGDIINRSSLILLISCNDKRILMLGDSHADTAYLSLRKLGYTPENQLSLSLLKLSHHGSRHNTSLELLRLTNCLNYYISTNGGRYDHPDVETIQMLEDRATELNTTFNIYLNYDIEVDIRYRCNFPITRLNFIEQCSIEYS